MVSLRHSVYITYIQWLNNGGQEGGAFLRNLYYSYKKYIKIRFFATPVFARFI
jgi:hypothetical protein